MPETPKNPNISPDPDDEVIVSLPLGQLPDGTIVAKGMTMADFQEARETEAAISTEILRAGDDVDIEYKSYDGQPRRAMYAVTEAYWTGLGAQGNPDMDVRGHLRLNDPAATEKLSPYNMQRAILSGSSPNGLRMVHTGVLMTGHSPSFWLLPKDTVHGPRPMGYVLNDMRHFNVKHTGKDGSKQDVHPQKRLIEMHREIPGHRQKIEDIQRFLKKCGFDSPFGAQNERMDDLSSDTSFENDRFNVKYLPGRQSNELLVYDKQTGKVVDAKYYPEKDILKVSTTAVDKHMSAEDLVFSHEFRPGNDVITHTTSERNDIDVTEYNMSTKKAARLGMPSIQGKALAPAIHITKRDGSYQATVAPGESLIAQYADFERGLPGGSQEYRSMMRSLNSMRVEMSPHNMPRLKFGEGSAAMTIDIYDPDLYLEDVLKHGKRLPQSLGKIGLDPRS